MAEICSGCGATLGATDAFCGHCGTPVRSAGESGGALAVPQQSGPLGTPAPPAQPVWPAAPSLGQHGMGQPSIRPTPSAGLGAAQVRVRPAPDGRDDAATAGQDGAADRALGAAQTVGAAVEMIGPDNYDPLYNSRYFVQVLRQAAVFAGVWFLIVCVSSIFFLLIGLSGGISGAAGAFSGAAELDTLVSILLAVLFWLVPVPALLEQQSKLIGNEGGASALVFRHVAAAFQRHQTPLDVLQEKTLHPPGEGSREYLELRRGYFSGYISCFAHGRDLYVGWTYWIRMSPLRWMLMRLGRRFQESSGRGNDIYQTLRFESARATVAAMQSAAEEGTATATAELRGQSAQPADPASVPGRDSD